MHTLIWWKRMEMWSAWVLNIVIMLGNVRRPRNRDFMAFKNFGRPSEEKPDIKHNPCTDGWMFWITRTMVSKVFIKYSQIWRTVGTRTENRTVLNNSVVKNKQATFFFFKKSIPSLTLRLFRHSSQSLKAKMLKMKESGQQNDRKSTGTEWYCH